MFSDEFSCTQKFFMNLVYLKMCFKPPASQAFVFEELLASSYIQSANMLIM